MNKISVVFPSKRKVSFDFGKGESPQKIYVQPYVAMYQMVEIIRACLSAFFEDGENQFKNLSTSAVLAEGAFDLALVDLLTNVDVLSDGDAGASWDELHSSGLMGEIKSRIKNISFLIEMRDRIIQDAMTERFSFKGLIDMATDAVSNLDMGKLAELQKGFEELKGNIEDSPLSKVFNEGLK